jgi:hypothetical protein
MIELMPAQHAARLHELLAMAAHRAGRAEQAQWLSERAALMAGEAPSDITQRATALWTPLI